MYGLDPNTKLDFLVGRAVTQIRIGEFQVQLCFDENVNISVEGRVSVDGRAYDDYRDMSAPLASLLGANVRRAMSAGAGDLVLVMSNGSTLVVHDSRREHESYTVTWKGGVLVV